MSKIVIIESDENLKNFYKARLEVEGYDVQVFDDGEKALATIMKELPDLVISEIQAPKISGFDILDIIKSTTKTSNVKVILLADIASTEQRERAETMNVNRYLIKSQVGIEDIVNIVQDVIKS